MQLTMEPYWSLQESVETMGVVSANLEVALDALVIQAILGNIAMKVSYIFRKHAQMSHDS